ncbi:hypothetical protein Sjap_014713 [Stephania japonica]|uniref:DUF7054 domain-containing protein n=1 Tax=Stephania japonica TaxID=461633 RepID=A0AAP0NTA7_9MAGN
MALQKAKKGSPPRGKAGLNRFLISVNVMGSAGPIRFLVNEDELVAGVIDIALKSYAREGRFPVLGSNLNDFFLYCANSGTDGFSLDSFAGFSLDSFAALSPWETIGSNGGRNFMLCKKQFPQQQMAEGAATTEIVRKGSGGWKAWLNKSLNMKISSH